MSGGDEEYNFGSISIRKKKQNVGFFPRLSCSLSAAFCAGFTEILHVCKLILKNVNKTVPKSSS